MTALTNNTSPPIILTAFGSTVDSARVSYNAIELRCRARWPEHDVLWAYTSARVREILRGRGIAADSVSDTLGRLVAAGHTRVVVQSLHVIGGVEFEETRSELDLFCRSHGSGFRAVLGAPLLPSTADMDAVVEAMSDLVPDDREREDGVVFIGHGSKDHPADDTYAALNEVITNRDDRARVGTLEGCRPLDELVAECAAAALRRVWLVPFITIAGEHMIRDIAGTAADTWQGRFEAEGISAQVVNRGMADCPAMVDVWLDHLQAAMSALNLK